MSGHHPDVVIIGSGPAGLAAAVCLQRTDLTYRLLEQGSRPAAALAQVDPGITLVSPTVFSRLPGMASLDDSPAYVDFGTYVEILEKYREQHDIEVTTNARVERVEHVGDRGFRVTYRDTTSPPAAEQVFDARFVINATGVLSAPRLPKDFDPDESRLNWCHSRDLEHATLRDVRRLLVVGGGISAADIFHDWLRLRSPEQEAWLSLRSRLWTAPKFVLGLDVHYLVSLPERLPIPPWIWRKFRRNPILGGELRKALKRGDIHQAPAVRCYHPDRVELTNGDTLEPDLLVLATGYDYATPHLGDLFQWPADERPRVRGCESLDTPGLFLLGIHFGRNFASPFLRGIASDAEHVVERIKVSHLAERLIESRLQR